MKRALAFLGAAALVPMAGVAKTPKTAVVTAPDWRALASRDDLRRIRTWRDAFVEALAEAAASGDTARVAAEGNLLDPDAALDGAAIPAGRYRCRTIKLGSAGAKGLGFVAYPGFDCRVSVQGAATVFEKLGGSQRPTGRLYPGGAQRQVFLGTLVLGDEIRALGYGRDATRDMAGAVERIGPQRWRLVFPYPRFESTLDVIELVPAS
ncbi:DUF4893 domain-containing protein [Sphingomonas sp. SUN039]|uniref:DUF4893 domain-containing protein n=1 Tax=Sphingomonas sp. SUN039 TaxID=2937787 RepID=UPI002164BA95|nr:DUF4893 domain-containing protein [Sphingomonas sp. SUN039]UVO55451.1 DUF4893 domain-containing protein [Sphingomonas sp. SUN039]